MSAPSTHATDNHADNHDASQADNHAASPSAVAQDAVEAIVPMMPIILPLVGGVTMLLIAFIAVFMA